MFCVLFHFCNICNCPSDSISEMVQSLCSRWLQHLSNHKQWSGNHQQKPQTLFLKLSGTGTVTSLVETVVKYFVPEKIKHYESLNYTYKSNHKKYSTDVPTFLQNRPRPFVLHCLKSITAACHVQDIVQQGDGICLAKSECSNVFYSVDLNMPSCECEAFQTSFLPCKHIFAVFNNTQHCWQSLPHSYTTSPYITLDTFDDLKGGFGATHFEPQEEEGQEEGQNCTANQALSQTTDLVNQAQGEGTPSPGGNVSLTKRDDLKTAQMKMREHLKTLTDATYLCGDLAMITKTSEALDTLKKSFLQTCKPENGMVLNDENTVVMLRGSKCLRALPVAKKNKAKKRKWNHNVLTD